MKKYLEYQWFLKQNKLLKFTHIICIFRIGKQVFIEFWVLMFRMKWSLELLNLWSINIVGGINQ